MIKTIELEIKTFKEVEKMLDELQNKKEILPKKIYKQQYKNIMKYLKQELKQIEKQHPIDKEIENYLKENDNA